MKNRTANTFRIADFRIFKFTAEKQRAQRKPNEDKLIRNKFEGRVKRMFLLF